jgi:indolepyruvate ferredoxin oxidoreductase alpha subunit
VWEAGVRVAAAYPGTPATEMLECVATYPDVYAEWSVNEKVSLEVAFGAAMAGSRSFCAMKHVGMNVASDALMTMTLTGVAGGLVIAIADDVGLSSSQNEQDSRYWGRFAHVPVLEPADSQEAHDFTLVAFELSERFETPVILRLTTRICHVKGLVSVGERSDRPVAGFHKDVGRWVMVPSAAGRRLPLMFDRERRLRAEAEISELNVVEAGSDRRVGFVTSGPAYMHVRESFPDAPVFKLGLAFPLPFERLRLFAAECDQLVVVEEVEPLIETELKAQGLSVAGKDILPLSGELSPQILKPAIARLLGEPLPELARTPPMTVFPHTLSQLRNVTICGDIGCYTLGSSPSWNALDTVFAMGASLGTAGGVAKAQIGQADAQPVLAVIGDSTFLHSGMSGLLNLDLPPRQRHRAAAGQPCHGDDRRPGKPGSGRDIHGSDAPRVDFARLVKALGVREERVHVVNAYELPVLLRTLRDETKIPEPSVIITSQPCVLIKDYHALKPFTVIDDKCTGCGNCIDVGCPAIHVTRRERVTKASGREVDLAFVRIESAACTGCGLCLKPCAPDAIVHVDTLAMPIRVVKKTSELTQTP